MNNLKTSNFDGSPIMEPAYKTFFVIFEDHKYGYFTTEFGAKEWLKDRQRSKEELE